MKNKSLSIVCLSPVQFSAGGC